MAFDKRRRKLKKREGGGFGVLGFNFDRPIKRDSEQDKVRKLVIELEEKRVLPAYLESEYLQMAVESVIDLRGVLTATLKNDLDPDAAAYSIVDTFRTACNRFLTDVGPAQPGSYAGLTESQRGALIRLRETFRVGLLKLAEDYELAQAAALAQRISEGTYG